MDCVTFANDVASSFITLFDMGVLSGVAISILGFTVHAVFVWFWRKSAA